MEKFEPKLTPEQKQKLIEEAEKVIEEMKGDYLSISCRRLAFELPLRDGDSKNYEMKNWNMIVNLSRDVDDL